MTQLYTIKEKKTGLYLKHRTLDESGVIYRRLIDAKSTMESWRTGGELRRTDVTRAKIKFAGGRMTREPWESFWRRAYVKDPILQIVPVTITEGEPIATLKTVSFRRRGTV